MSTTPACRYTPDDLLAMPDGDRYELVDGELVERDMSGLSSEVARKLAGRAGMFADEQGLGHTFGPDCGYQCFPFDPGRVRGPDASFIRADRISAEELESGHISVAPDLAVEVISPNDQAFELNRKIEEYLRAGVRLVWVIDPLSRTVDVYRPQGSDNRLREHDELSGEDVLPGFRCPVRELFPIRPSQPA